jgi:hypothetical protein
MSMLDLAGAHPADGRRSESALDSPFGLGATVGSVSAESEAASYEPLVTPFDDSVSVADEHELERALVDDLRAELEDEEFDEALESLVAEAAARHLRSIDTWSSESLAHEQAASDVEQWLEQLASAVDHRLDELDGRFADRTVVSLTESEVESIAPDGDDVVERGPLDAQEQFFKKLFKKVKKTVRGVGKLVKRGVRAVGRLLPFGKILGLLKRLVRPLLRRVLQRAIGKLPTPLRPHARRLAKRFGLEAEGELADGPEPTPIAEQFDEVLAELLLAPDDDAGARLLEELEAEREDPGAENPVRDLDRARRRLAEQLMNGSPGVAPTEQMEQFIPAVMAAMPLLRLGVKTIGRRRVESTLASLVAGLIKGMVGPQAARLLSAHIARTGLGLLGLEAEAAETGLLGAEALVAATEDTVRDVLGMEEGALDSELLLEAAIQESFREAALRHLPAEVLRSDLVAAESEGEHGVWVMMPRRGSVRRYKKYSQTIPVRIGEPLATRIILGEGDTLADRLLDAGVSQFPVEAELHLYEALPGAELGHLAAFELDDADVSVAEGIREFDQLSPARPLPLPAPGARRVPARVRSRAGRGAPPGTRWVRIRVRGVRLRARPRFAVRLDLTGPKPQLRLDLPVGERDAHTVVAHLGNGRHVQVVAAFRRLLAPPLRAELARRLERLLSRHGVNMPRGGGAQLADAIADLTLKALADRLPSMASELQRAAQHRAPGVTVSVTASFDSKGALLTGSPQVQQVLIRAGWHRG